MAVAKGLKDLKPWVKLEHNYYTPVVTVAARQESLFQEQDGRVRPPESLKSSQMWSWTFWEFIRVILKRIESGPGTLKVILVVFGEKSRIW